MADTITSFNGPQTVGNNWNNIIAALSYARNGKRRLLATFESVPDVWSIHSGLYDFDLATWIEASATPTADPYLLGFTWNPDTSEIWACGEIDLYAYKSTDDGATWIRFGPVITNENPFVMHYNPLGNSGYKMLIGTWDGSNTKTLLRRWTGAAWTQVYDGESGSYKPYFLGHSDNYVLLVMENSIVRFNGNTPDQANAFTIATKITSFGNKIPLSIWWDTDLGQYLVATQNGIYESTAGETSGTGDWTLKWDVATGGPGWSDTLAYTRCIQKIGTDFYAVVASAEGRTSEPYGWVLIKRNPSTGGWAVEQHWTDIDNDMWVPSFWGNELYGKCMQLAGLFESSLIIGTHQEEGA